MRLQGAILLLVLTMSSCSFQRDAVVAETPTRGWWSAANVTLKSRDTLQLQQIAILLRYHSDILLSDSLSLNIVTITPRNQQIAEQMTIPLRSRDSLSRRGVELIEVAYRNNIRWREMGEYRVSIYPTQPTDGVEAVGVVVSNK